MHTWLHWQILIKTECQTEKGKKLYKIKGLQAQKLIDIFIEHGQVYILKY